MNLTLDVVKNAVPAKLKDSIEQSFVDKLNNLANDPIVADQIRNNFISYAHVINDGKFSIEDVFHQYGIKYTVMEPHVVHPSSPVFAQNLIDFAAICRVVNGMRKFSIGCIGARTTAFKTVRFDEITLQK